MWHKAVALTDTIYLLIAHFPPSEANALTDQARFMNMAFGSACELENCLGISRRQNFGQEHLRTKAQGLVIEVKKMLSAYIKRLRGR